VTTITKLVILSIAAIALNLSARADNLSITDYKQVKKSTNDILISTSTYCNKRDK